jgi:hypothetical protein
MLKTTPDFKWVKVNQASYLKYVLVEAISQYKLCFSKINK